MTDTSGSARGNIGQLGWENVKALARKYGSHGALLILLVVASLISPNFLDVTNIFITLRQAAALGIVAVGQTFVILAGGTDLAVGSVLSLSLVLVCNNMQWHDSRILPLLLLVVGIGALIGAIDGFFIAKLRVPAIVMTLGMQTAVQGALLMYSKAVPLNTLTDHFRILGLGKIGVIPIPVIVWVGVVLLAVAVLNFSVFGRHIYAMGGNTEATRLSGVNVGLVRIGVYVVSGITAALAGYVMAARIGVGDEWVGAAYGLDSIAAVVIGGTSMAGGRGNVVNTVSGVLILSVLYNVLLLLGVNPYWQGVVKGLVVLAGVILYTRKKSW